MDAAHGQYRTWWILASLTLGLAAMIAGTQVPADELWALAGWPRPVPEVIAEEEPISLTDDVVDTSPDMPQQVEPTIALGQHEPYSAEPEANTLSAGEPWRPQPVPDIAKAAPGVPRKPLPRLPKVETAQFDRGLPQLGERYVRRRRIEPELTEVVVEETTVAEPVDLDEKAPERLARPRDAQPAQASLQVADASDSQPEASAEPEATISDLDEVDLSLARGEVLAAHKRLSRIYWEAPERRPELDDRMTRSAGQIFFSPQPHFNEPYIIQPNDQLRKIADKYQLSWQYLAQLNRTDPKRIQPGKKLKVMKGPFSAVVELDRFLLTIHLQGYIVKTFPVGIGKESSTPIGVFRVLNKVENPQYTGPDGIVVAGDDPTNPLGERWIDLGDSYGIHGTTDPDSIGKAESRGCIRLRNGDVQQVYDFLVVGSEVVLRR